MVYIIREKYGIQHPEGCRKQRPGKNIPPLRRLTRRKIIHCRGQQNQRKAHGKETRLCPEGDKFHRNRQKLRHIVQNRVPDNHQKQHCRNQKQNEYCQQQHPQRMMRRLFAAIDIRNLLRHISYRPKRKPQRKHHTKSENCPIGAARLPTSFVI